MPGAYYNEHDKAKAATLRNLIEEGAVAHGVVDERSILEVQPEDLAGFAQCHFFAGGGLWSLCLRLAGWPDDRPVWTGSCPCGPFSKAGLRKGFDDPRHLWPQWLRLICECRPHRIFGEQSDEADAWLDLVQADLESRGYAIGSAIVPAAGFGGAHGRHRIGFVADADDAERWAERAPWNDGRWPKTGRVKGDRHAGNGGAGRLLGHANGGGELWGSGQEATAPRAAESEVGGNFGQRLRSISSGAGGLGGLDYPHDGRRQGRWTHDGPRAPWQASGPHIRAAGLLGGAGVDWLACRDGRWRPIESGLSPLVDAHPGRLAQLRLYGDAIDVEAFTNFIGAYLDARAELSSQSRAA